jgi:hypothetical protein
MRTCGAEVMVDALGVDSLISRLEQGSISLRTQTPRTDLPPAQDLWTDDESDGNHEVGSSLAFHEELDQAQQAATMQETAQALDLCEQAVTDSQTVQPVQGARSAVSKPQAPSTAGKLRSPPRRNENRQCGAAGRGAGRGRHARGHAHLKAASSTQGTSSDDEDGASEGGTIRTWRAERHAMKAL